MMYAGSKNKLVHTVQLTKVRELRLFSSSSSSSIMVIKIFRDCGSPDQTSLARVTSKCLIFATKRCTDLTLSCCLQVFEIRNTEDLTEEWLREKLGFFG